MRAYLVLGILLSVNAAVLGNGHGRGRAGLVGYGPVNPYKWTMTSELYTTDMAPTFRELKAVPFRDKVPESSTEREKPPAAKTGSKPSIVLPPPNAIPNPQLTPPPPGGSTTNPQPAPPTPASVKPSSRAGGS